MTEDRAGRPDSFQLPCFGQTADSIERWVKAEASPGSIVVVRHTRWHLYEYHLDEVAKLNLRAGRIYLAQHGRFSLHGNGISGPKGCRPSNGRSPPERSSCRAPSQSKTCCDRTPRDSPARRPAGQILRSNPSARRYRGGR